MQLPQVNNPQLLKLLSNYWQWRVVWMATTVGFMILGLVFVVFLKGDTWVASQAIIVRDEANGAVMRLGRFESQTEMKAAQETILEMARNPQVVGKALTTVGRTPSWRTWLWGVEPPTTAEIEDTARNCIVVRAPRGAELGTTEVIYIDIKQSDPKRAMALNRAVCDALEERMQQVRQVRADGVVAELQTAKDTAAAQLKRATDRLTTMEAEAGADLSDLRNMTESNSGGISNRTVLDAIKTELRQAELQLQQLETDLQLATESFKNPDQLLLTPSTLVNNQTGLRTLRDGLANATINTSQMRGRYTETHPLVQAALTAEGHLREQLRNELGLSVQTLSKDREIAAERVEKLVAQRRQLESRLDNIANIRAEYANVASEVRARNLQLQECERELAQAQASREAALTSSLITRLDQPTMGEKPIGPSRSTIVLAATLSGLFFGWGIVFLLAPLDGGVAYGRRRFDYSGVAGRRASDKEALALAGTPAPASEDLGPPRRRASDRLLSSNNSAADANSNTLNFDLAEWTRPLQLGEKLGQILHAWRTSQLPIKPHAARQTAPAAAQPAVGAPTDSPAPQLPLGELASQAALPPKPTEV